jgi:hypothetical protein
MLTLCTPMSSGSDSELVLYRYTLPGPELSISFRLSWDRSESSISRSIVFAIAKSNSTAVPKSLVLASYPLLCEGYEIPCADSMLWSLAALECVFFSTPRASRTFGRAHTADWVALERLDTLPADYIALGITLTLCRRSSVAERGSHNP